VCGRWCGRNETKGEGCGMSWLTGKEGRGRGGWGGNSLPVSWGHREGSRRDCSTRIKGWGLMWLL